MLVDDVMPYELMKLRLLNAGHQALCYFAYLAGYRLVHDAAGDPLFAEFLQRYMDEEGTPSAEAGAGHRPRRLQAHGDRALRQSRRARHHRSAVLRVVGPHSAMAAAGGPGEPAQQRTRRPFAAVVASWARYAEGVDEQGEPIDVRTNWLKPWFRWPSRSSTTPPRSSRTPRCSATWPSSRDSRMPTFGRRTRCTATALGRHSSSWSSRAPARPRHRRSADRRRRTRRQVTGEHVGGSPLNVAVGLGRLGREVDFLTHIGTDDRGRRIVDHVELGVALVPGSVTPRARHRTGAARRTAQRHLPLRHRMATGRHPGGGAAAGGAHRIHRGVPRSRVPGGPRAARRLPGLSATITYDPNVRPALIADGEQALSRIDRLVERSDVVKVSDEDLRWLDPDRSPEQIARVAVRRPGGRRGHDGRARRVRHVRRGNGAHRGAEGRGRGHRRRGRRVHDGADRRAVDAGSAGRRPASRPAPIDTTTLERVLSGGEGVGDRRRPGRRGLTGSRRSASGATQWAILGHAFHLEGIHRVRAGERAGQGLHRDRGPRHQVPPGPRQGQRTHPLQAGRARCAARSSSTATSRRRSTPTTARP